MAEQTLVRYGESFLLPKYCCQCPFYFERRHQNSVFPFAELNVQEHIQPMVDHAYSLQGMSTLASPHVSLASLTVCLQRNFQERMLHLSQSFFPFFLHFSVIRFGRRKLAPAALAHVSLGPARPTF